MFGLRYLPEVVTLALEREKCTGCGLCVKVCPQGVFEQEGAKVSVADRNACMECGACALNCPADAISVQSGVGCVAAVILGALRGTEPSCDCCCGQSED